FISGNLRRRFLFFLFHKSIRAMPATGAAAISPIEQIFCREYPVPFFQVIVFAFHQLGPAHTLLAILRMGVSGVSTNTPSLKLRYLPEIAGTRSPGTTIPARFNGSAADIVTISPVGGMLFMARRDSTATGKANCSPMKPLIKRPPRISPRSSSRRNEISRSRQRGSMLSRTSSSRKTTPYRSKSTRQTDSIAHPLSSPCGGYCNDHRPALWRGRLLLPLPCPARRLGSIRARRLSKPSAVTRPAATSSHKAVSISAFSLLVPRTISAKNDAPRECRKLSTSRAPAPSPRTSCSAPRCADLMLGSAIHSASSRTKNVMGATLVGTTLRPPPEESSSIAGCGVSLPHPIAPVRHS